MNNDQAANHHSLSEPTLPNLWRIAVPLSGAMLSQSLLGLVDTALVGHLGGLALASVSIGSYLVFILVALITGFGTGWHNLISKHGQTHPRLFSLGLAYAVVISITVGAIGGYITDDLINMFVLDDRINTLAADYAQARLWALPAIALSIGARIYWSELGAPWQYTKILLLAHLANVPISYGLIYGLGGLPAMGAVGAGIGTSIAVWLGVVLQALMLFKKSSSNATISSALFSLNHWQLLLRFTWPPMLQQFIFSLHLAVFLWIISLLGASVMAASFSVLNVGLVLILPAIGLGQSALSLLGAALANGNKEYIIKWSKLILHTGVLSVSVLALFVGFAAPWLAQILLVNRELQQLTIAALPWYAAAMVLEACIIILGRFVLLTGQRKTVLLLMSASQWLVFLPLLYWLSPAYGFMTVWWLHVGYRVVTIFCFWWMWRRFIKGPLIGQMSTFNKE